MQLTEKIIEHKLIEAENELRTLRDLIRFGVSLFYKESLYYGHGTDNAYDEVVYLCLHSLHLPLNELVGYMDARLLRSEIKLILNRFKQRVIHKIPASYITNHAVLHGFEFYVDRRTIIPRSFIPGLIINDKLLPFIEEPELVHEILDLCTGNGSIAIIAAHYFPDSHIVASDIDSEALQVAKVNVDNYDLAEQIDLVESNLFDRLKGRQFDLILSNPPYVDKLRMDNLTREYSYEPSHALSGGVDGLTFVRQIIDNAANYLTDYGVLVVEMGDNVADLEASYPHLEFTWLEFNNNSGEGIVFALTKQQLCSK